MREEMLSVPSKFSVLHFGIVLLLVVVVAVVVFVVVDLQPYVIHFQSWCIGLSLHIQLIHLKFIFNLNLPYFTELKLITALKLVALNVMCAAGCPWFLVLFCRVEIESPSLLSSCVAILCDFLFRSTLRGEGVVTTSCKELQGPFQAPPKSTSSTSSCLTGV